VNPVNFGDTFGMSINDEPASSRRFVAHPPMLGSKGSGWTIGRATIVMVAVAALMYALPELGKTLTHSDAYKDGLFLAPLAALFLGFWAYRSWYERRQIRISVTSDGLTVNQRPNDVFSFSEAQLGPWGPAIGTALHLHCGPRHFVLGGRDHRVAAGTRLEAPDVGYRLPVDVDAWLWASDFDELLTMVGRRSRLDVRQRAPGEPDRCLLLPNDDLLRHLGTSRQYNRPAGQPQLAIDVFPDTIRVIDPNTNELKASASVSQVTATPETYVRRYYKGNDDAMSPVLVVHVPGMRPLAIGCHERTGSTGLGGLRFSWRGKVPERVNDPAPYKVTGRDWLTLVEKLGLAPNLERHEEQG
jgi:hypothetical protein